MDINTQNSSGMMNGMPPANLPGTKPEKKVGPIIGALIIVILLIIAALYFFAQRLNTQAPVQDQTQTQAILPDASATPSTSVGATAQPDDTQSLKSDLDNQLKNVDYSF